MSQFTKRFQSFSSPSHSRESEARLRITPEAYAQENSDSAFVRRHQETQKIKNLSFWENTDQETSAEEEWSERQSPTPFILVMIVLVVASTLLWFLFQWATGENSNTPPVIAADTAPFKVRPENPGGMMIPHQDKLVYGRLSQDASQPIERLLPPPEQPMTAEPMAPHPMAPQPMNPQPMTPPLNQSYPETQSYNSPQNGYHPSQGGYAPNPTVQQGPQYQPQPQSGGQYQPYITQPPQATYQPTPTSPYPASPQQGQMHYGPSQPLAAGLPPAHPIPLISAANPIPEKQLSAVEGIRPAQEAEEEEKEETGKKEGIKKKEKERPTKKEEPNDLETLIAQEAQTPFTRSTKKNDGKMSTSKALSSGKNKAQSSSLTDLTKSKQKVRRLKQNQRLKENSDSW